MATFVKMEYNGQRLLINWNDYWVGSGDAIALLDSKTTSIGRDSIVQIDEIEANGVKYCSFLINGNTELRFTTVADGPIDGVFIVEEIKNTLGVPQAVGTLAQLLNALIDIIKIL